MTDVPWMDWYQSLAKPSWTPAPRTIGLIWQILYPVIIVTFGYVFVQVGRGRLPLLVALPFAINLVANLIFTPIQFGMRNLPLAAVDISRDLPLLQRDTDGHISLKKTRSAS